MSGKEYIKMGDQLRKKAAFNIEKAMRNSSLGGFDIELSAARMLPSTAPS